MCYGGAEVVVLLIVSVAWLPVVAVVIMAVVKMNRDEDYKRKKE